MYLKMAGGIQRKVLVPGGPERRILLVGRCKSGKSETVNTILGKGVFKFGMSWKETTKPCQKKEAQLKGRKVVVVDTPDFSHPNHPVQYIAAEVSKGMKFCSPGPHVILHVMRPFLSTQEETYVTQQIKDVFGPKAKDYTILLFTNKDDLRDISLEKLLFSRDENLKEYFAECGNRKLAFNNMAEGEEREAQMAELMNWIDDLVKMNRDAPCYTEDMMNVSKRHKF